MRGRIGRVTQHKGEGMSRGTIISLAVGAAGGIVLLAVYPDGIPVRITLTLLIGGCTLLVAPWVVDRLMGKLQSRNRDNRR